MSNNLESQIQQYLDGQLPDEQIACLEQTLATDASARELYLQVANLNASLDELAMQEVVPETLVSAETAAASKNRPGRVRSLFSLVPWSIAAVALLALFSLGLRSPASEPSVAKITGLDGALVWTGDGGRVVRDVTVGMDLPGGTIEGMTPDSWFELEFLDGSKAVIVGNSTLTFSDDGQKRLRLKEGRFSADVQPQPPGRPMVIETRSATYEVVGTRFQLDTGLTSSVLNVSEGKVLATRKSDGASVAVPAKHRAVASPKHDLAATPIPKFVTSWQSDVPAGPYQYLGQNWLYGDWSPEADDTPARLATIPYTIQDGSPSDGKTIYTAAFGVSGGDQPPVVLAAESTLRLQARITTEELVFFGCTLQTPGGEFAGRYQVIGTVDHLLEQDFINDGRLDITLPLSFFQLDPSLEAIKDRLPTDLAGLTVESCWCHTLFDPAGLAVESIEIVGSSPKESLNESE